MDAQQEEGYLSAEERLFAAIINGSPVSALEGLLTNGLDVDTRGVCGRTALHLAVKGSKVEWMERLFELGADPRLKDDDGSDVLDVAQAMVASTTDDNQRKDRELILKMVRVMHQRIGVQTQSQTVPRGRYGDDDLAELASIKEAVSLQSKSLKEDLILNVMQEIESPHKVIDGLRREIESRDALLIALQSRVASLVEKYASLEGVVRGRMDRAGIAAAPDNKPINKGG